MANVVSGGRLCIAVDFGTTYSGVAAAYSASPETVEVIRTWPGGNGVSSDKVPTQLVYELEASGTPSNLGRSTGDTRKNIRWGYEVTPNEDKISCIKLFLQDGHKPIVLPSFVSASKTRAELKRHGRDVESAIADFLKKLHDHTMEHLTRRFGESFMRTTKKEFVLTIPAIWSSTGQLIMSKAAKRAGFGDDVKMISEPEAAAVHTLSAIQSNHLRQLDNIVILDCGGGTVDVISYQIMKVSPLEVRESTVGTGGMCGGAFINARFIEHVKTRLGGARLKKYQKDKPRQWMMALDYFEDRVKRWYGAVTMQEFEVPFAGMPDDAVAGIEDNTLIMSAAQVKDIFDPVIDDVIVLVEHQRNLLRDEHQHVAAVLLVGGFGQSSYLYRRLKAHFQTDLPPPYTSRPLTGRANAGVNDRTSPSLEIMTPSDSWTAVVRGALQRGLQDTIVASRKSRHHYGIQYTTIFDSNKHPLSSRYYDSFDERYRADGVMQWCLAKGENVATSREVSFNFTRTLILPSEIFDPTDEYEAGFGPIIQVQIYVCDEARGPLMFDAAIMSRVCTLTADLTDVDRLSFKRRTKASTGEVRYEVGYRLVMRIDSASLHWSMRVDGETCGSVTATLDN